MVPQPGMPEVVEIEPGLNRWTFASEDPDEQEREFDHWLGYFGHEETDEPISKTGFIWLVRKA